MTRWIAIACFVLGASLGCNEAPPAPDKSAEAVPERGAGTKTPAAQAGEPGTQTQARSGDHADEGCPYAKKQHQAAADEGCPCGKGASCGGDSEAKTGCGEGDCPCKKAGEDGKGCADCPGKADGECGCSGEGKKGCPHAKPDGEGPHASIGGSCPYLHGEAERAGPHQGIRL
ncbi:MAG: hypothetical protein JRI23_11850 [Deltaproteobacteria bacterium]|nr:hypothetical protein [Deltaproteobacteria bacterium]MBW2532401.1 hypothetical protein [Deltaproteobacteria bacterium]